MSAEHDDAARRPTQVLVVGAGPVGMLAGLSAARCGLAVEVLDESPRVHAGGHATLLHASSIRLLEGLGLADQLLETGYRLDRVSVFIDGTRAATLELPSPVLAVPQSALVEVLQAALRAEGVEISRGHQATTIAENDDRVHVRVICWELARSPGNDDEESWRPVSSSVVETDFVIGADGRGSRVRAALGIETADVGGPASYAMFELPSNESPDPEMVLAFSEGLASAMIPLPGARVRWGFQLASPSSDKLYAADLCGLLAQRAPWHQGVVDRIDWGSVVRFERRLARRFGKGRVWLAGDAAHATSPLGGQSMNVGLSEARDLVRRIAECVEAGNSRGAVDRYLEQYGAESQREWQTLLGFNVSFDLLPHAPAWLAAHARRIVPAFPASGFDLESLLGQLGLAVR